MKNAHLLARGVTEIGPITIEKGNSDIIINVILSKRKLSVFLEMGFPLRGFLL